MGQLQLLSLKHQLQTSFVVTSAVAILPSLLAALLEEGENEEEEDDGAVRWRSGFGKGFSWKKLCSAQHRMGSTKMCG